MEIEGHPSQDLIEELERRGVTRLDGSSRGPSEDALRFAADRPEVSGFWLFVPAETFQTGFDELPG